MRRLVFVILPLLAVAAVTTTVRDVTTGHAAHAACAWPNSVALGALPGQPLPMFCDHLMPDLPETVTQGPNTWLDDFEHGGSMAAIGDSYRTFEQVGGINQSGTWRHSNHWMVDVNGYPQGGSGGVGGSMLSPNRSFRFENGALVVEADVAAGILGYTGHAWPELVVSTSSQPFTGPSENVPDYAYAYGWFPNAHTIGIRLQADGTPIAALFSPNNERTVELSHFQLGGAGIAFGGGPFPDQGLGNVHRFCDDDDPDLYCRDRFRWELTKNSYTLYVNGVKYMQHANLPPENQLPDAFLNSDVYVYFASWIFAAPADTVRFHWDRLAVNPPGGITAPPIVPLPDYKSSEYTSISPERILDTRPGSQIGYSGGKPDAGHTVELQVSGRAGVPADAVAAVLNLTGTDASAAGYVTAYPCGGAVPNASNLNLAGTDPTPNLAVVKLGAGGKVCLFTQSGAHLIADIAGYFPAGSPYVGVQPKRLLDTRSAQIGYKGAQPAGGQVVEIPVAGQAGVPANAKAAVLNLTGAEPGAVGFVTAYPCGAPIPNASNLNLSGSDPTPNLAVVKLGAGGKVCLFTYANTHLIADLAGYYPATSDFIGVQPERLLDSRTGPKPNGGQVVEVQVSGRAGVPSDAVAAVLNVTGADASDPGYVTAYPCGAPTPLASNLNLTPGATRPNLTISRIGVAGEVCLFTYSSAHLIVDITGYVPAD